MATQQVLLGKFKELQNKFDPQKYTNTVLATEGELQAEQVKLQNQDIKKLDETLGELGLLFKRKAMALSMALASPYGYVRGSNGIMLMGGSGTFRDLSYTAPESPSKRIFATARILANILKGNEDALKKANIPQGIISHLEDRLVKVHQDEVKLYTSVAKIDELQRQLRMGNLDDKSAGSIDELLKTARENHKTATEKREKFIKDIRKNLAVPLALMNGSAPPNFV